MLLFRLVQVPARGWAGQETHHEVLQEPRAALQAKVGTPGEVTGLLEKDGVGAVDLADVDLDVILLGGKDAVHDRDVLRAGVLRDTEDDDSGFGLFERRGGGSGSCC